MNLKLAWTISLAALLLIPIEQAYAGRRQGPGNGQGRGNGSGSCLNSGTTLTSDEVSSLMYMYEEEKLARDIYAAMASEWKSAPFYSIGASEARHQAVLKKQLDLYRIDSSSFAELSAGQYANAELQSLYESLLSQGNASLAEAFKVGAAIEEHDILDLNKAIGVTQAPGLKKVYNNLLGASKRHLAAFTNSIAGNGATCSKSQMRAMTGSTSLTKQLRKKWGKGRRGDGYCRNL